MENLEKNNIDCQKCTGVCCTVARNSMQVTPVEAINLYFEIKEKLIDQKKFWELNLESIKRFGLDREIYIKGKLLRKNYTCPLFKFESWGCPIDKKLKPLGCLGYNALASNILDGENCASNTTILEKVDQEINPKWNELNLKIKKRFHLDFDKISIPRALEILHAKNITEGKDELYFDLDR